MNEEDTICVIKILPSNVEQPITGIAVCLSAGLSMNCLCFINTKTFLNQTGACDHCFGVKVEGRDSKSPTSTVWRVMKGIFIPMNSSDMATEEQLKGYINNTFMPSFYNAIRETNRAGVEQKQLPLLRDKTQIHTVSNWSDAIYYQEDIVILVHMVLELSNVTFKDWIDLEDGNIYSLFRQGQVPPYTVARFGISWEKLDLEDQINFAAFLVEQKRFDLLQDEAFLEEIKGKKSLTSMEHRNLQSIIRQFPTTKYSNLYL